MNNQPTFATVKSIIDNWQELDGLRNDEAIKAFSIRNTLQSAFQSHFDNREKISKEIQELVKEAGEVIKERREEGDKSVANAVAEITSDGRWRMSQLPKDMKVLYQDEIQNKMEELNDLADKKVEVEFDPLTRTDLKEHNLINGKILRMFDAIIDLSDEGLEEEAEAEEPEKNGQKMKRKKSK